MFREIPLRALMEDARLVAETLTREIMQRVGARLEQMDFVNNLGLIILTFRSNLAQMMKRDRVGKDAPALNGKSVPEAV